MRDSRIGRLIGAWLVDAGSAGLPSSIAHHFRSWDRRLRAAESLIWGARGLAAGLFVAGLIAVAARLWPLLALPWLVALAGLWALVGLMTALSIVWLWPRSPLARARFFDWRLDLRERLSTAVEIEQGAVSVPEWMARKQLADALDAAQEADPAAAIPLRIDIRDWLPAVISLALLAAALWLPNPMQDVLAERAAVREALEGQVEVLEALAEEIASDPRLAEADQQELLEILDGTVEKLQAGNLTREEALADLTDTGERLRDLVSSEAERQAAGLQGAAAGLAESAVTGPLAGALLDEDYVQAAEVLEDLSNDLDQQLTRPQELELARRLGGAAAALAQSNPELAGQLVQAAESIQDGDIAAARQGLDQASRTVGQTGQRVAASRAAESAAGQVASSGQEVAQAGGT